MANQGPFLLGENFTEADIKLFVTLIRFDTVYYSLFKCNLHRLADYKHVSEYVNRVFNIPGIRETVCFDHIKRGYYSIKAVNPLGTVPIGPEKLSDLM
ncbi:Glutathionyl-hydroquinone reductase YqjG [compost metagenome]